MAETLTIKGIDELQSTLTECLRKCPDSINTAMRQCAKGWKEDVKAKLPSYYKRIPEGFTSKGTYGGPYHILEQIEIGSKTPEWHLVENGHRKFDFHGHDTGGFVPGRHYGSDTTSEWEEKFPEELEKNLQKQLAKAGFS